MQNSKDFSGALDAKPFVPRKGATSNVRNADGPARMSGDRNLQANAQPFIPLPTDPSPMQLRGMSSSAQPFVPQPPSAGSGQALRSPAAVGQHPLLPDSDAVLGMTAGGPEEYQHHIQPISSLHASPSRSAVGSHSAHSASAAMFRQQGQRLELPTQDGNVLRALMPPGSYQGAPGAPRGPAAALQPSRSRGSVDVARGRARKPGASFALPGPQPPAMPQPLHMVQVPHMQQQPQQQQPPLHAAHPKAATSKAAMLASASAERLRQGLAQRSYDLQAQPDPDVERRRGLPDILHDYHSLLPLEDPSVRAEQPSAAFGLPSLVLKGINLHSGQGHAIRRLDTRQMSASPDILAAAHEVVSAWAPLAAHPHLTSLQGVFASPELGSGPAPVMCVAHTYHPGAVTLEQAHLQPTTTSNGLVRSNNASEDTLWSYLVQLTLALRAAHTSGLACRPSCLHHSKVLLVSPGRLRVGSVGMPSILSMERHRSADPMMQAEDIAAVAQLMMSLACAGGTQSVEALASRFSPDFTRAVHAALPQQKGGAGVITTWHQLSSMLGERMLAELDARALGADAIERTLSREAENGRMLRLLVRLSFVHERPRADASPDWSDTGDRYLLKLFHDWLFASIAPNGRPLLDWGRVVEALNKLDAGLPERVSLLSRDEATFLTVSYSDLKRCLASSYNELQYAAASAMS